MAAKHAIQLVENELRRALIDRDVEIRALMLGLLTGHHVLLVGPPGTGKSMLCRSLASAIEGARYCERLLSPTTPPEALFGPISISALKNDRYEHVGKGTVTDAEIVFLDEFFRGSDAIRDTLLHLLGPERQALIGSQQVTIPLLTAVAATNAWPQSADQAAILDRWLIRREVRPLSPGAIGRLIRADLPEVQGVTTMQEIMDDIDAVANIPFTETALSTVESVIEELVREGIRPSDRRCRASIEVAQAAAYLDGAAAVETAHLAALTDVLWDTPGEAAAKAAGIILRITDPVGHEVNRIMIGVEEILSSVKSTTESRITAINKLTASVKELSTLNGAAVSPRGQALGRFLNDELTKLKSALVGMDLSEFARSATNKDPEPKRARRKP